MGLRDRAIAAMPGGRHFCPLCGYRGRFMGVSPSHGVPRRWAKCPSCRAAERHRLQAWAVRKNGMHFDGKACLQFAPDPVTPLLRELCEKVITADIYDKTTDLLLDLRELDLDDESFDIVYASDVLEHVDQDVKAISEIRRVLRPGGFAVLPVPLVADKTVEYGAPNPLEEMHVRAPGWDYFHRYQRAFERVEVFHSGDAPEQIQPWVYENRERFPTFQAPKRPPMHGEKHLVAVPFCWKEA